MEPSLIIPILVSAGYLRPEQVGQILSLSTKTEHALLLLALLHRNGKNAYHGLFKALREETEHGAHLDLLRQLESTCECKYFTNPVMSVIIVPGILRIVVA